MPDQHAAAAKLTGWELPSDWLDAEGRDNDELGGKIVASIDAGRPVVAYPPIWNMGVVYGYEDGGRTLLVDDYMEDAKPSRLPVEKLGPLHVYLGEHTEPPPLRDALLEALQTAVRDWRRERHQGGLEEREYWYGDAALAAWIADLRGFGALSDEAQKGLHGIDGWNYTSLHDARKAAVQFLKDWATVLDGESRAALGRAGALYEEEVKLLEPLVPEKRKMPDVADWSEEAREREVEILAQARSLEAQAIGEIEKALAAEGVEAAGGE